MKKELIDMLHQKCGRLTIISRAPNKNTRAHWNCLCECGNTTIVSGKKLRTGQTQSCGCLRKDTCKETGKNNRLDKMFVKQKLQENGYELLSSYKGTQKTAKVKCIKCNHIFTRRIDTSLYNQHGCPRCSFRNNGFIRSDYFNKHPEMKNKPCKVYLLKFSGNNEEFYKIGITRQSLKQRTRKIPYDLIESEVIDTTYYNAYLIEKSLKQTIKPYSYYPKIKFNGASECFIT
jgi:DNA-directed RNA polymerase subunit RPC12/RpoP